MRFEKWQALGNDYAIVESEELPFELTPERIRAICALHEGVGSDGILQLTLPVGQADADREVLVTVEPAGQPLSSDEWRQGILKTAGKWQGDFERPA